VRAYDDEINGARPRHVHNERYGIPGRYDDLTGAVARRWDQLPQALQRLCLRIMEQHRRWECLRHLF
jgi:hypothetical protein